MLTGYNTDYGAVVDLMADLDPAMPFLLRGSGGMAKAVAALQALQQFVLYTGVRPDGALVADAARWARSGS